MSITADIVETPAPLRSTQRLRLRLKPAHRSCGHVQGAWWPYTTRLTAELPALLDALAARLGPIQRVSYHDDVAMDAGTDSPQTLTLFGEEFGRLTLLVIPPYTDPSEAYATVVAAADADDTSTPAQLLGSTAPRCKERKLARLALSRWETEGGSLYGM